MHTDRQQETAANACWKLLPQHKTASYHEQLVANELQSPEQGRRLADAAVRRILRHSLRAVPYYRELWRESGLWLADLDGLDSLGRLPLLDKAGLINQRQRMLADYLLPGQQIGPVSRTAGTTGQPTAVTQSNAAAGMFAWLKQRELRWFRIDPRQEMLSIRPSVDFPKLEDGNYLADGSLLKLPAWPYIGNLFATGAAWAYNTTNKVADQAAIMARVRPGFVVMQASCLEYLSMQDLALSARENLQATQAISQTLTGIMHSRIEQALGVPVYQNYGLNEIGLVASKCREGGRYHVHTEHCVVELLRDDGSAAAPGEYANLVVTSLQNSAMPLIRYATGDKALVLAGDCPCGRTLPSFGEVLGRYRRLAYLPEGSYKRFSDIHLVIYEYAEIHKSAIKKYQVYEYRNGNFEVRLDCEPAYFEKLARIIRQAFEAAYPSLPAPPLEIIQSAEFYGTGLSKFQIFISEFFPEPDLSIN